MATLPKVERVKVRTAEAGVGPQYVIIEGAPEHYITGYGIVGPGDIVTLQDGVAPGKYLQPVNPSDIKKVAGDDGATEVLAARARERAEAEAAERAKVEQAEREAAEKNAAKNAVTAETAEAAAAAAAAALAVKK